MKAILVIDMPKTCSDCPLSYFADPDDYENDTMYCKVHNGYMEDAFNIRAVWCPLRPMPEKEEIKSGHMYSGLISLGWNACIDELEGKE